MTLNELLAALVDNENLNIEIIETVSEEDNVIIEFEAPGYEALSSELLARTVDKVKIIAQTGVSLNNEMKITVKVI